MTSMIINSFIFSASAVSTLIDVGYIPGTFTLKSSGSTGMWAAFDGVLSKIWNAGAITPTQTTDGILGYDFEFSKPAGIKIEKVEVTSSNNQGFIVSFNPTDTKISLEGWNGSIWVALGDTGLFTDGAVQVTKTITSTDQVTLFTRFRVLVSTTQNSVRTIAQVKLFEVTAGEVSFNLIDGNNITPALDTTTGSGTTEKWVDGTKHPMAANVEFTNVAGTADLVVPIVFDTARVIEKAILYGTSDGGFLISTDPTDVQIDLEGWNGSSWVALGNTGTFTDANSLVKIITSTDQVTTFTKARILISTASSDKKTCGEIEIYTPV